MCRNNTQYTYLYYTRAGRDSGHGYPSSKSFTIWQNQQNLMNEIPKQRPTGVAFEHII